MVEVINLDDSRTSAQMWNTASRNSNLGSAFITMLLSDLQQDASPKSLWYAAAAAGRGEVRRHPKLRRALTPGACFCVGIQRVAVMQKSRKLFATLPTENAPYSLDCISNLLIQPSSDRGTKFEQPCGVSYRNMEKFAKLLQMCNKNAIIII